MDRSSGRRAAGIAGFAGVALLILAALPASVAAEPLIGPPTQLVFGVQPFGAAAGATIVPAVTVAIEDASGNLVTNDSSAVTLVIGTNPGPGTLGGTTSVTAVGGIATFSNLSIDNAGTGYTLIATDGSLASASSAPFTVTPVYSLSFVTQPGGGAAGTSWAQQPMVEVVDSSNQVVSSDSSTIVSLGISANPAGGTLSCASGTTLQVTNGVASFSGCSIDVGSSSYYSLSAWSTPSWSPATSDAFYVGGPESLVFATQPGGGAASTTWAQQPMVYVVVSSNQVVSSDSSTIVSLGISANPSGGTLSCTSGTSVTVVSGVASFYGCSIDAGSSSSYTLAATSSPAWSPATSSAFSVMGARSALAISASSALGRDPASGYTTSTPKVAKVGTYATWEFTGGTALAGQRVDVLVARDVAGAWGSPTYLKSAWADANGVVTFSWTSKGAGSINVRILWPGNATYTASTSRALAARWR